MEDQTKSCSLHVHFTLLTIPSTYCAQASSSSSVIAFSLLPLFQQMSCNGFGTNM